MTIELGGEMVKAKRLSRKQLALTEDLYSGKLNEQQLLDKHKLGRRLYRKWLADSQINEELGRRIAGAYRQSTFVLARNACEVAETLVKLTKCEKEETARKACLDIITMNRSTALAAPKVTSDHKAEESAQISPQAASRILAILAEENVHQ